MRASASRHPRRGGALVLALLFMGLVTAAFATWVTVIRQRTRAGDLEEHQARKRLSAINSEIMVRDYLLRRMLASNGDPDGLSGTSDGAAWNTTTTAAWDGQIQTSAAVWNGYPMDSSTRLAGLNGFSPTFDYPYSKSVTFVTNYRRLAYATEVAQYANDTTTWRGYVRSRNPVLGGDLLVLHRPTVNTTLPSVTGNVAVNGRVLHFAPDIAAAAYTARSLRFTAPAMVTGGVPASINVAPADLAGAGLPWSNLTWTPLSCGNINGANLEAPSNGADWRLPDFTGQLNFIDSAANPSNTLRAELIASGSTVQTTGSTNYNDSKGFTLVSTGTSPAGTGLATIFPCNDANYPVNTDSDPYNNVSDLPSVLITDDLTELIIDGQTGSNLTSYAPYRPSFAVVYTQNASGRNLTTIRLRNQNNRRMILALKKDHRATWPSPATTPAVNLIIESPVTTPDWHVVILCENVPLTITYAASTTPLYQAATVRLYGGIETNAPLLFPASPKLFEMNLETDTRGLIRMTPRLAWVETFLTGKL